MLIAFYGCQENDSSFGDIVTPSNIVITAEIVGQDTSDPALAYGDGSGKVNFTATASDASSYVYYFDGIVDTENGPSGVYDNKFL